MSNHPLTPPLRPGRGEGPDKETRVAKGNGMGSESLARAASEAARRWRITPGSGNSQSEQQPALTEPVVSTRDLADLARSGYQILQQPFTHVDFEVHHNVDRPGYLRDKVFASCHLDQGDIAKGSPLSIIVQTLASGANGVGLVIGTNGRTNMNSAHRSSQLRGSAAEVIVDESGRRVFRGIALPNPTFLFESAQTYEGIVSVEPSPTSIKFYQSTAVRDLIREISRIAGDVADAPLLFLQAPAQLPAQNYIGQSVLSSEMRAARRSSSLAVRFAIALQRPSAELRFRLTDILSSYCSEKRFGLWLADTRIGYRSGNWFQICPHPDDLPRRERRDRAESMDSRAVEIILPVTFVGPARKVSTHKIVSLLCQFSSIGIVSCSVTTFDDIVFIHLDLTVRGVRRSEMRLLNDKLSDLASWATNPAEALLRIHEILVPGSDESSDYVHTSEVTKHCGDYQTLAGPVLGCTMPERRKRLALWLSWQTVGTREDVAIPLVELLNCLPEVGFDMDGAGASTGKGRVANLEYLILRDIGNSVFRGRGKFSVSEPDLLALFGGGQVETAAVKLCISLENAWKASLRRCQIRGVSELTVTWHEWWLGHWASPI